MMYGHRRIQKQNESYAISFAFFQFDCNWCTPGQQNVKFAFITAVWSQICGALFSFVLMKVIIPLQLMAEINFLPIISTLYFVSENIQVFLLFQAASHSSHQDQKTHTLWSDWRVECAMLSPSPLPVTLTKPYLTPCWNNMQCIFLPPPPRFISWCSLCFTSPNLCVCVLVASHYLTCNLPCCLLGQIPVQVTQTRWPFGITSCCSLSDLASKVRFKCSKLWSSQTYCQFSKKWRKRPAGHSLWPRCQQFDQLLQSETDLWLISFQN